MQVTSNIPVLNLSPEIEELWDNLNEAFQNVLRSGQFIMGPMVHAFETEVAKYLGAKYAIGVNSGTDALVIGLRALRIGEGDEVITTPFSFFATAESISIVGAKPIFVDVDISSFNIDPSKIESAITPKTKAILPVHLYGNPAAMSEIMEIAARHGLSVIEDCAQSFGAQYWEEESSSGIKEGGMSAAENLSGRFTGTIGDIGAFSFFPSKNLGAFGDGGLIVTDNDELAKLAKMLRVHGAQKKYYNEIIGYNSRLDELQAALLRVKLPHSDKNNNGRRRVAALYDKWLRDLPNIDVPSTTKGHVYHQYTIRVLNGLRDKVKAKLDEHGINTMIYYPVPQDQLPIYYGRYSKNPVSDQLATEVLSLPMWPTMEAELVQHISAVIHRAVS
jgi:dTDP-4-amino-4,6-dideoxygalactose transaminase